MSIIKGLRNVTAFLTRIPMDTDSITLEEIARYMYLFPLVGAFIGLLAGSFGYLISHFLPSFPSLLVGILTLSFLELVTGMHHIDGLIDFGDGIMVSGPPERKVEVMHDTSTGAGGVTLGLVVILITAICISEIDNLLKLKPNMTPYFLILVLMISEVSAKLAMVTCAWKGNRFFMGLGYKFVEFMRDRHGLYFISLIISLILSLILGFGGVIIIITGIITGSIMILITNRNFRGMTGDSFGATNEIARMNSLLIVLVVFNWLSPLW